MKKTLLALFVSLAAGIFAQDEVQTLVSKPTSHGGYIGIVHKPTKLFDKGAFISGGEIAWVIDRKLAIGFFGQGTTSLNLATHYPSNDDLHFETGQGGIFFEPMLFGDKLIHLNFPIYLGSGVATYTRFNKYNPNHWDEDYDFDENYDLYYMLEPGIRAELNFARFLKFGLGASYRYVYDIDLPHTRNSDVSGLSAMVYLKLGWY